LRLDGQAAHFSRYPLRLVTMTGYVLSGPAAFSADPFSFVIWSLGRQ